MTNTIFINVENKENNYICNICNDNIENDKIIGLKCNPTKHIFCYECIFDWYKELKFKKSATHHGNYENNTCPICRVNCGLLPRHPNYPFISGLHQKESSSKNNTKIKSEYLKNYIEKTQNQPCICNAKLVSKDGFCKSAGKNEYGGFCGKHKNMKKSAITNINPNTDNDQQQNINIDTNTLII
jgi:hypothetical protein